MLRLIGSVTGLALLMVACGGGNSDPVPPPLAATYTVGGTVTGLSGSGLVLSGGFGNVLRVSAAGTFTFDTSVVSGTGYAVTVEEQPNSPTQFCFVANGFGTIAAEKVTNVSVTCDNGYTVGGSVSGLVGSGLVIQLHSRSYASSSRYGEYVGSPLKINANGAFTLDSVFPAMTFSPSPVTFWGYGIQVRVIQQPSSPAQQCVINNAGINITTENQADISVVCSGFVYVANAADDTLSAYRVDATTGALLSSSVPTGTGKSPNAIAGAQDKRFVFAGNEGSNAVSAFAVDTTTGALTAVPGSPFAAGTHPQALALYWYDSYLYVANAGSDNVSTYSINANTGALTPLSPATNATGKGPASIAVYPDGPFLYVANNGGSNDISAFSIDAATGALALVLGSPFPAGGNPLSLAFGVRGKFLYSANPGGTNSSISGFSIDPVSGALSPLSGSPFPVSVSHHIATDRTGTYLYVTTGSNIVGYGIDATTGALIALPGFPIAAGANAYSVSIDPTDQFLYVANDGAANIAGFSLDASTGALTPMSGSPFPAGNRPDFLATL